MMVEEKDIKHNKQVFLFELDSVRKTDEEIIYGQKMLFDEIVRNGNVVVLTYNQLIDSRGFFSLINNPEMYEYLMYLFDNGYIKISQYGSIRTVAQYVLESIEKNLNSTKETFLYSALPVRSNQKYLLDLMKRSLMYSDFTEIDEYISGQNTELNKLFKHAGGEMTDVDIKSSIEILKQLRQFMKLTLDVSHNPAIYNPPRKIEQYNDITFRFILTEVVFNMKNMKHVEMWSKAIQILKDINKQIDKNIMSRTIWHQKLYEHRNDNDASYYQYAEAIVDLCYNYRQELSIYNISKHYNTKELEEFKTKRIAPTFTADFLNRLEQDWNDGKNAGLRYLQDETNEINLFHDFKSLPNWKVGLSILNVVQNAKYEEDKLYSYETNYNHQIKERMLKTINALIALILVCVLYVVVGTLLEIIIGDIQDFSMSHATLSRILQYDFLKNFIWVLLFVLIGDYAVNGIQKVLQFIPLFHHLPEISLDTKEAFQTLYSAIKDIYFIATHKVKDQYLNESILHIFEQKNTQEQITIPLPYEIKEYMKLYNQTDNELFKGKDLLSKEELNHGHVLREYALEHGIKMGLAYKSSYHMMLVDLVKDKHNNIFAYERVTNTVNKGAVVVVVKKQDKFILLKQYRHSMGEEQWCFPRGYGEVNIQASDNVRKEIKEELNADIIGEPKALGQVVADSGLCGTLVDVYLAEIAQYDLKDDYEGIHDIKEVTEEELYNMNINDGFTLAALTLLKKGQ